MISVTVGFKYVLEVSLTWLAEASQLRVAISDRRLWSRSLFCLSVCQGGPKKVCVTNCGECVDNNSSVLIRRICTHPLSLCNSFSQIFLTTQGQFGTSIPFLARLEAPHRARSRNLKATRAPPSAMLQ
jgi:hypothetical protein